MAVLAVNSRNQFQGRVRQIHYGPVVSEVEVDTAAGLLCSVVTTTSLEALGLKPGDGVLALFKATEVILAQFQALTTDDAGTEATL